MMKWSLIALVVVAGLLLLVVIVGTLLPRNHVVAMNAKISASPANVWSAINDVNAYPSWRTDLIRVEVVTPAGATFAGTSWREVMKGMTVTMAVDSADAPRRLVTRIADTNLPFGGTWTYDIQPSGDAASSVTITEHGTVSNPVFRFVSKFLMGQTATMDTYLRALGRRFGSETTPTVVTTSPSAQ